MKPLTMRMGYGQHDPLAVVADAELSSHDRRAVAANLYSFRATRPLRMAMARYADLPCR